LRERYKTRKELLLADHLEKSLLSHPRGKKKKRANLLETPRKKGEKTVALSTVSSGPCFFSIEKGTGRSIREVFQGGPRRN